MHILLEPGRSIIAPAGVLLTRVVYTKTNRGKTFVVVDSANERLDAAGPSTEAISPITKVVREAKENDNRNANVPNIVGPVCEGRLLFAGLAAMEK